MSCALSQGYALDCRDSAGGVDEAYFIEFDNVTAMTVTAGVITAMTKASAKRFWKYKFPKETASFKETQAGDEKNGTSFWTQTLAIVLNKMQTATRNELILLSKNRLLVVYKDMNGAFWMLGQTGAALMKTSENTSGTGRGDRNGYNPTFEAIEKDPVIEVQASVAATLETPGP
jgi:hypothetical protein